MAINQIVSTAQRHNFKRIIAQLDKAHTPTKILKIVSQAGRFLAEHDIGWDAVFLRVETSYVPLSRRRKAIHNTAAKVATALHPTANGTYELGADGRALLKRAVTQHPDWPTVRDTLSLTVSDLPKEELIAVAQLLGLDHKFVAMFTKEVSVAETQADRAQRITDRIHLLMEKDNSNE